MLRRLWREGWHKPEREKEQGQSASYILVILSVLGFLLLTGFLLNHAEVVSQEVRLSYFKENVGQEITPAEALNHLRNGHFKKIANNTGQLDLGYLREGVWVLMEFENPPDSKSSSFVLQLRHTYINGSITEVAGTSPNQFGVQTRLLETKSFTDKLLPKSQQLNDVRHVSFPVKVQPGERYVALVRLRAHVMNVPFLLLDESVFLSSVIRELVPLASLFGGLILLALYNGLVGIARREPEFIFYGIYVASIALMAASINGTGHMFLWPDQLWLHYNSANILINIVSLSYMAFSYYIFSNSPLHSTEKLFWMIFSALGCVGLILQVIEGGFFASIQANIGTLAALTLGLIRAWKARPIYGRIANLFILSEGVLFAGAFAYCIKMFGWLSSTAFTLNIVLVAATLEAILLSFVLSEKMRRTMGEKEEALHQLEKAHVQLEENVRDKTLALAARYTSHEVLNPVFAIRLKTERICDEVQRELQTEKPSLLRVSDQISQKSQEIFNLIDSIIQTIRTIKTMSSDGQKEEIVIVDLKSAFEDAVKMLEVKRIQSGCLIYSDFSAAQRVKARKADVVHVIANLISNALDALVSQEKSWIRVTSRLLENWGKSSDSQLGVEISVYDSGAGVAEEIKGKLFANNVTTKGGDLGMGLGLSFCQRLVSRNQGTIHFDAQSKITRFYFILPNAEIDIQPQIAELRKAV